MFRVAYRSVLRADLGQAEIQAMFDGNAQNNEDLGVNSAILINNRKCLHAVEGAPKMVRSILEAIWDDRRHEEFAVIDIAHGESALFPEWSMKVVTPADLKEDGSLKNHEGIIWLSNLAGGLGSFFEAPDAFNTRSD